MYGAMLVHRKRRGTLRGGNYAPAANPAVAVETGYAGAYGPGPGGYYESAPAAVPSPGIADYKHQSAYGAAPAYGSPTPPPQPQYYGQAPQPGSYELDNRVHG